MFNLFGKIGPDYRDEELLKGVWGEPVFSAFQKDLHNSKRKKSEAETLADRIMSALEKHTDFQSLEKLTFAGNSSIINALRFDMKFLMMASLYYERINNRPSFGSATNYYKCFQPLFSFHVKRKDIHGNNNNQYPLKQFMLSPYAHNLDRISNFMDLGLIIGLMDSYSGRINPYIHPKKSYPLKPLHFLQTFRYAYIDKSDVDKLLTDTVQTLPTQPTAYGPKPNKQDEGIFERVRTLKDNINSQIYAVLNQFFIERLTNFNFIISLYDYKVNYAEKTSFFQKEEQLLSLLTLPLLNFRLTVLDTLKEPKSDDTITLFDFSESINLLEEHILPLVCGTYLTLAEKLHCLIGKDERFLNDIYADPSENKSATNQYQLFKLKKAGIIEAQIVPVEKFHVHDKANFKIPELDELDRKYFDNAIKAAKTDSFETILNSIILPAYETESSKYVTKSKKQRLNEEGTELFKTYCNWISPSMVYSIPQKEKLLSGYAGFTKLYNKEADKLAATSEMCADIQNFVEMLGGYAVPGTNTITVKDSKSFLKLSCDLIYFMEHTKQNYDFSSYIGELVIKFDRKTLESFWDCQTNSFLKARISEFDEYMNGLKRFRGFVSHNPEILTYLEAAYSKCLRSTQRTK